MVRKATTGDNSKFEAFAERIGHLLDEKAQIAEAVGEVYAEAKSAGLNPKAMRKAIAISRKDQEKWKAEEAEVEILLHALGLI
jgi:uncharacterized protein (UPF0335 family)